VQKTRQKISHLVAIFLLAFLMVLVDGTSVAATSSPGFYEVRKGDFLGRIATSYGVTVSDLRKSNNLSSDVLQIGQKIRIDNPFQQNSDVKNQWKCPIATWDKVLRSFGPYKKKGILMPSTGTDLACAQGTALSAPAIGVVRHIGHMDGFGTLIIIEHPENYATVLSPLDPATVAVQVGQALLRGDHLGRTGPPPENDTPPYLHVELRKNDKAIKPDPLLK
jgi:murein DD-endopeptidase MepM/ murein hydrolase activator NlpD